MVSIEIKTLKVESLFLWAFVLVQKPREKKTLFLEGLYIEMYKDKNGLALTFKAMQKLI